MTSQKNYTLELLKLLASYMVVFIHVSFKGGTGVVMDTLARFAVPLFFLISGYFSYQISPKKITKRIKNILSLFIFATVCYTLFEILVWMLNGDMAEIGAHFYKYLDFETLIKLVIFNVPLSSTHLWYLLAALYTYIIFYFCTIFDFNEKKVVTVSFLLLLLHLILGEGLSIFGIVVPIPIVRNFLLMGIPFFVAGMLVKKHEHILRNIPNYAVIIAALIGILESIFSRYFFGKNEIYIGSLFVLFAVVVVFVKFSMVKYPAFFKSVSGCSTYVYVFHIIISTVIIKIYRMLHIDMDSLVILKNIHPIIVCIASTAFAYCIIRVKNFIHGKRSKISKS